MNMEFQIKGMDSIATNALDWANSKFGAQTCKTIKCCDPDICCCGYKTPPQPAPAQPAPVEPAPVQPAPCQTAACQTTPVQPAPCHTAPCQTAPCQPAPCQPAPCQTAPAQYTADNPACCCRERGQKTWPVCMYEERVCMLGVPVHEGQNKSGVAWGPYRLRQHGLVTSIQDMGFNITDLGDIPIPCLNDEMDPIVCNIKRPRTMGILNYELKHRVADTLRCGCSSLILDGDHNLAIGSILGQYEVTPDIGVIYVDAHADLNPPLSSYSGHSHGMPLAFLLRELREYIPDNIPNCEWIQPCLNACDVVLVGLRDVDEAEKFIIDKYNITAYSMHDIIKHGIDKIAQMAVEKASRGYTRPIQLNFDIDALDPNDAPSTGTPVGGGLTLREGIHIVEKAACSGLLRVFALSEVNPELLNPEDQHKTLESASLLIKSWFGVRNLNLIHPTYSLVRPTECPQTFGYCRCLAR